VTFATGADRTHQAVALLMQAARHALQAPDTTGAEIIDNAFDDLAERWESLREVSDQEENEGRWSAIWGLDRLGNANELLQRSSRLLERAVILRKLEIQAAEAVAELGDGAVLIGRFLDLLSAALVSEDPHLVGAIGVRLEQRLIRLFSQ
jgi:hypothetical protein